MTRAAIRWLLDKSDVNYRETKTGFRVQDRKLRNELLDELTDRGVSVSRRGRCLFVSAD